MHNLQYSSNYAVSLTIPNFSPARLGHFAFASNLTRCPSSAFLLLLLILPFWTKEVNVKSS